MPADDGSYAGAVMTLLLILVAVACFFVFAPWSPCGSRRRQLCPSGLAPHDASIADEMLFLKARRRTDSKLGHPDAKWTRPVVGVVNTPPSGEPVDGLGRSPTFKAPADWFTAQ